MATDAESLIGRNEPEGNLSLEPDTGIEDDLEEYGVWVKVGPEDLEPEIQNEPLENDILDSSAGGDEETHLTEEEEQLLGDLEDSEPGPDQIETAG